MNIRFVTQDVPWTESMKAQIRQKIAVPLARHLQSDNFEMSVHFQGDSPRHTLWVVLQTFDGRPNQVVRCSGSTFNGLANDISREFRARMRKAARPSFLSREF